MQIPDIRPCRAPANQVAERLEEAIGVIGLEGGLAVQAGAARASSGHHVRHGSGRIGGTIDAVGARAHDRRHPPAPLPEGIEQRQGGQDELLVSTATPLASPTSLA